MASAGGTAILAVVGVPARNRRSRSPGRIDRSPRRAAAEQPEFRRVGPQGVDHEPEVVVERNAEQIGTGHDLGAVDRGGEALVLEALLHRRWLQAGDAVGANEAARHHKAGWFVARE